MNFKHFGAIGRSGHKIHNGGKVTMQCRLSAKSSGEIASAICISHTSFVHSVRSCHREREEKREGRHIHLLRQSLTMRWGWDASPSPSTDAPVKGDRPNTTKPFFCNINPHSIGLRNHIYLPTHGGAELGRHDANAGPSLWHLRLAPTRLMLPSPPPADSTARPRPGHSPAPPPPPR